MATTDREVTGIPGAPNAATPPTTARGANVTLAILCAAVFLTALDQTVVVTALVPIADSARLSFTSDLSALSWIISGYLLGYVIVMPLMGRVSDVWGRRRILLGCLAIFAAGSLLCALAIPLGNAYDTSFLRAIGINSPSAILTWLVTARFIQAVGGGAIVPVAIATAGDFFGDRRRILALGIIGGVTEAGGAIGPLYGALILEKWPWLPATFAYSWQWIFLLNLPLVAIIAAALVWRWPKGATQPQIRRAGRIDWLGAAILGGALACVSLGLGQEAGAVSDLRQAHAAQNNPLLLVAAVALLGLFIFVESRRADPVIHLKLFRSAAFSADSVFSLLLGMALIIALVDIPAFIFVSFANATFFDVGFALLRMTVMIPIGAFAGGWLAARLGCRPVGTAGALFTSAGLFLMHFWPAHVGWGQITLGTVVAGIGFGLIIPPISTTALHTTTASNFGMSASIVTALRMVGMIFGIAGLSSWGVQRLNYLLQQVPPIKNVQDPAQVAAYAQATAAIGPQVITEFFLIGAVLALLAVIPALFLWQPKPGEKTENEVAVFSMGL